MTIGWAGWKAVVGGVKEGARWTEHPRRMRCCSWGGTIAGGGVFWRFCCCWRESGLCARDMTSLSLGQLQLSFDDCCLHSFILLEGDVGFGGDGQEVLHAAHDTLRHW